MLDLEPKTPQIPSAEEESRDSVDSGKGKPRWWPEGTKNADYPFDEVMGGHPFEPTQPIERSTEGSGANMDLTPS